MRKINNAIQLSATDVSNYVACHHLSYLELCAAEGLIKRPTYRDPLLAILQERGQEFEASYLQQLKSGGLSVEDEFNSITDSGFSRTMRAMVKGIDIIYQATLEHGVWNGRADFLKKVDRPSKLGNWSYEVIDSKLAKETRAGTLLQLCLYSQIVADIQGFKPDLMHVITPDELSGLQSYRVDAFMAYYRLTQNRLLELIKKGTQNDETYPHPTAHCDICLWWGNCNERRRNDDHLSLVAGLTNAQRQELVQHEIHTLADFAALPLPLPFRPGRGAITTFERLREQARVQLAARKSGAPIYEMLEIQEGIGLSRLPEPASGDIFFDLESDPFAGMGGLEYLFGWELASGTHWHYENRWALTPADERVAFELFIRTVMARWSQYPDMHIYHYSPYEPAALKRLMGKYNSCEEEIDELLRAELFVDLHSVTRQALRAGIEVYSLKELEAFHDFEREMELRQASLQLRTIERFLERSQSEDIPEETLAAVALYNHEDCLSTRRLRDWLESLRSNFIEEGADIPRPVSRTGEASEALSERQEVIRSLYESLVAGIPENHEDRDPAQQATWLLAQMLDWHRREEKSMWWEYFRLLAASPEDLLEEKSALSKLQFTGNRVPVNRSVVDEYLFPAQECDLSTGDKLRGPDGNNAGEVESIDLVAGLIRIKKGNANPYVNNHPVSVFAFDIFNDANKPAAILRFAQFVRDNSMDSVEPGYRAARDLLMKLPPRTSQSVELTDDALENAMNWAVNLSNGTLAIQGPPGAGKSHTGAKLILELVKRGKRIGITALSHKVVRGLLNKILELAEQDGISVACLQKVTVTNDALPSGLHETKKNEDVLSALRSGAVQIAGGVSWLWAREEMTDSVDYLFIDEAGQFSLADTLAIAHAGNNLVLLGDPQQLKQPLQGSHPDGVETSALEHILLGHATIPAEMGIFLDKTWRLHPDICAFISELFYERRLNSRPGLEKQRVNAGSNFNGSGLRLIKVIHSGNQGSSAEEVDEIVKIVRELTNGNVSWTDAKGVTKPLTSQDIKIIAPYNAQVAALLAALPGFAIGTVDKFQGQEAPVIICSMATSSPEDAPRGMDFLYSGNRLNVAVSRAKALFILVANPRLFEPDCRTLEQMKLANAYCRYVEMIA